MAKKSRLLPDEDSQRAEQRSVPFLRPFEWVATALTSFRERPLPSAYQPTVQPTFDLFASSRIGEFQTENIAGVLGSIEVFGPRVATDKYRLYWSVDVFHDDPASDHQFLFARIVPDPVLGFPINVFAQTQSLNAFYTGITANEHSAVQNVLIPPDGRIEVVVDQPASMGAGARITMRNMFIELDIGEPAQGLMGAP